MITESTQRVNFMNILKSKKGIAIENALLFMMIIFGLCFLVSFVALIGHHQYRLDKTLIVNRATLDQIGEDFVRNPAGYEYTGDKYGCSIAPDRSSITVTSKSGGNVMLYVKVNDAGYRLKERMRK